MSTRRLIGVAVSRLVVPSSFICGGGYLHGKGNQILLRRSKMIGNVGKRGRAGAGRYMISGGEGNVGHQYLKGYMIQLKALPIQTLDRLSGKIVNTGGNLRSQRCTVHGKVPKPLQVGVTWSDVYQINIKSDRLQQSVNSSHPAAGFGLGKTSLSQQNTADNPNTSTHQSKPIVLP